MGAALSDLASGHRRDGHGQARNRRRVASQGLPVLLAMAITWSGMAQDQLSLLKISTGPSEAGDFHEPAVP